MPTAHRSSLVLTPRDIGMLEQVYAYHGCGFQHLHRRFWPNESTTSATYRRVSRLVQDHYLAAYRLPSLTGQGSGKAILTLGYRGRRVLAERRGISARSLPRLKIASSALFVHHHFAVCDVRVALEQACERVQAAQLADWTAEAVLKRAPMKVEDTHGNNGANGSRTMTLIPDGAFDLSYKDREQRGLLEMDMGTLAPKRLQQKLRGYLLLHPQLQTPVFFLALTERRVQQIRRLAETEAERLGADPTFLFLTTLEKVTTRCPLTSAIWEQCGVSPSVTLLPVDRRTAPDTPSVELELATAAAAGRRP